MEAPALSAAWWHLGPPCTSQVTQHSSPAFLCRRLDIDFDSQSSLGHPAGYASTPAVDAEDYGHTVDGWNPANQLKLVVYPCLSPLFTTDFYTSKRWFFGISSINSGPNSFQLRVQQLTNGLSLCNAAAPGKMRLVESISSMPLKGSAAHTSVLPECWCRCVYNEKDCIMRQISTSLAMKGNLWWQHQRQGIGFSQ